MTQGQFITFEGLDGSGKTTLSKRYYEYMRQEFIDSHFMWTREPNEDAAANDFLRAIINRDKRASDWAIALAFALNRADHIASTIIPALLKGQHVICDRYLMSSLAYNTTSNVGMDAVWFLNRGIIQPSMTIFLDASPEVCKERIRMRAGQVEVYDNSLTPIYQCYGEAMDRVKSAGWNVITIDANRDMEAVFSSIVTATHLS